MIGDETRTTLEAGERRPQGRVSLIRGPVEAVVGGQLARDLPDTLLRVELRGVARQAMQLDFLGVRLEPCLARVVEPVTGPVVDDEEELAGRVLGCELQQEFVEGVPVEDRREAIGEVGVLKRDSAEDVGGLPLAEGVDARLLAYARPSLMEGSVEPEARFVLEEDDAATGSRFFLIAGNVFFSHTACSS